MCRPAETAFCHKERTQRLADELSLPQLGRHTAERLDDVADAVDVIVRVPASQRDVTQ